MQKFKVASQVHEHIEHLIQEAQQEAASEGLLFDDTLLAENLLRETIASVPVAGSALAYLTRIVRALRLADGRQAVKDAPNSSPWAIFVNDHVEGELHYNLRWMGNTEKHSVKEAPDVIFITMQKRLFADGRMIFKVAKAAGVPFVSRRFTKPLLRAGLSIGSDPKCDISINDPALRPVQFRVQWVGHHWYLLTLDETACLPFLPSKHMKHVTHEQRVDYRPFAAGAYVFQLIRGGDTKARFFAERTKAWFIKHAETLVLIPLFLIIFGGLTAIAKLVELS